MEIIVTEKLVGLTETLTKAYEAIRPLRSGMRANVERWVFMKLRCQN